MNKLKEKITLKLNNAAMSAYEHRGKLALGVLMAWGLDELLPAPPTASGQSTEFVIKTPDALEQRLVSILDSTLTLIQNNIEPIVETCGAIVGCVLLMSGKIFMGACALIGVACLLVFGNFIG